MSKGYNPENIEPHKGKSFVTVHDDHRYTITPDGRFSGRKSIEGAEVEYIAGFDPQDYLYFRASLISKKCLDKLISEIGEEPRPGLHLVVSLTPQSVNETGRTGMVTSRIKNIKGEQPGEDDDTDFPNKPVIKPQALPIPKYGFGVSEEED